jgi:hypothetical protein
VEKTQLAVTSLPPRPDPAPEVLSAAAARAAQSHLLGKGRVVPPSLQFRPEGRAAAGQADEHGGRQELVRPASLKAQQEEAQEYSGEVKDWPAQKKKNYYDRLSSILKQIILLKNLQVKFR